MRWQVAPVFDDADQVAQQLQASPLMAQLLANRGVTDVEEARGFLQPKLSDLYDPAEMAGCQAAAERIAQAIDRGEKVVVYGDYDVDGMTATAILDSCIKMLGGEVDYYVPHRLDEGYGVNREALEKIIADGAGLIVTVDCGISAAEVLTHATDAGVDVIVTDHHTVQSELPAVTAIVHPTLPGENGKPCPNPHLCGAGVAFKLAWQTARLVCGSNRVDDKMKKFLLDATCLAALGTIADVVPMVGENRVIAAHGLRGLPASTHVGLRGLLKSANLADTALDSYHVGFVLAPRLNAAGRMGHARLAIELLTTDSPDRAREIADYLANQNTERQKVERGITAQAIEMVEAMDLDDDKNRAIVLASRDWHGGVIGIVASRLVDRFHRPAMLVCLDENGNGQGSGRSIPGFNIADALQFCDEHLVSYGGHAMAGGLQMRAENFDAFAEAFGQYARQQVVPEQLTPALDIDAETTLDTLGYNVVEQIGRMAPFGAANRHPVIAIRGCRLMMEPKRMGRTGATVSLVLKQGSTRMRTVGFGMGDLTDLLTGVTEVDIAGEPMLNTFQGQTTVEIRLKDVIWKV
ncbi:MAG: single-stranded-DNA-specific exonuclease RecJ [Phycisphaerae bacterium]|nr:single-stranded-DNA-specific exonuclease RecJ [Phycisphaerae bacterium]